MTVAVIPSSPLEFISFYGFRLFATAYLATETSVY